MADDLNLTLRIRGDAQGAKAAAAETRAAIQQLRNTAGPEFKQISSYAAETSAVFNSLHQELFGKITNDVAALKDRSAALSTAFNISTASGKAFSASVDDLAKKSGKSNSEIAAFINTFAKLETQTAKTDAAFKFFGGSVDLIGNKTAKFLPELENLAAQSTVASGGLEGLLTTLGPVGIAIAGIAIQVGATAIAIGAFAEVGATVVNTFLDLAKSAAGFRGELFDLSQQTGVSVETLSALSAIAETTGSNMSQVAAALGIFQKNLEAAQDPTSKQAQALKQLGVETSDTETALRDTLKRLALMPEGFHQTALALELFGRGGKSILAILKEMHGDLDGTIERLSKMGLIISTEDAQAADHFNDQLRFLELRFRALIGKDVIPAATDAVEEFGKFLDNNKDEVNALNSVLAFFANLIKLEVVGQLKILKTTLDALHGAFDSDITAVNFLIEAYQSLRTAIKGAADEIPRVALKPSIDKEFFADLDKALKAQLPPEKVDFSKVPGLFKETPKIGGGGRAAADPGVQLLHQLQEELRGLETSTKAESIAAELLDTKFKNISGSVKDQILLTARLIDVKRAKIETDRLAASEEEKFERARAAATEEINNFLQRQAEDLKRARGETETALDQANKFISTFENVGNVLDDNEIFWLRFNATLIESAKHVANLHDSLSQIADMMPAISETLTNQPVFELLGGEDAPKAEKRFKGLQSALDDLGNSFGKLFGASKDFGRQFGDVIGGAVDDLAFGIGNLVEQYVLLGETGPHALRKLLAATLAHLAAEAAVKAVFQLAEGFAALFFNPAEAAAHFQSAALFGSIAGVAAVAGRSAAGDLFKNSGAGAGGGTSGGIGQLNPLTLNRNQPNSTRTIVLQIQSNDSHIVKVVGSNIRQAGDLREIILNDGIS